MPRALVVIGAALTLACGSAAAAAASGTAPPPRSVLQGFVCQRAPDALDRAIAVTAVMRPVAGTQRMEMRFVLLRETAAGSGFASVPGRDLGRWLSPKDQPTLGQRSTDVWKLNKLVANLSPSVYRFRVSFRWLGAYDAILDHSTLVTPLCTE